VIFRSARVSAAELERVTGWALKPKGLCRDERCVPFATASGDGIDLAEIARALGMPLVEEPRAGLWALGPESGGNALESATLPDITLPDVNGRPFHFASLRGRKALIVAWASW
jgi:hypothetical protein